MVSMRTEDWDGPMLLRKGSVNELWRLNNRLIWSSQMVVSFVLNVVFRQIEYAF